MKTITWVPGTDKELDQLYDDLRDRQYRDRSHRLWKNYSKESFEDVTAITICWDDQGIPEMCSSIINRSCWPNDAYRILNRTWKVKNKQQYMKVISEAMGAVTLSQIAWLKDNRKDKFYFISRQTDNWMTWVSNKFKSQFDLDFKIAKNKYLTCSNERDETCWQHIIYTGDKSLLNSWKSK